MVRAAEMAILSLVLAAGFLLVSIAAIAGSGSTGDGAITVRQLDGRLYLQARAVSLPLVLERVSREVCLRFQVSDAIESRPGNWRVDGLPVEEALFELVRPYNAVLVREPLAGQFCIGLSVLPSGAAELVSPSAAPSSPAEIYDDLRRECLGHDARDLDVCARKIRDLAGLSPQNAIRGLEIAIGADDPELRREAVDALGQVYEAHEDSAPLLLGQTLFGDKDVGVRLAAIRVLARMKSNAAHMFLRQALADRDESVRAEAAGTLGESTRR